MSDPKTFMSYVRKLMLEKEWTSVDLSRESGIPQPQISRYLNGVNEPQVKNRKKIADALGIDYSYILDDNDPSEITVEKTNNNDKSFMKRMMHYCGTLSLEDQEELLKKAEELVAKSSGK